MPVVETSSFEGSEIHLLEQVLEELSEGRSDDWIAKHVVMKQYNVGYYKAKSLVSRIREKSGS